ncbi:hypothetical protein IMCC3317_46040 [Kordia antarctica]|uniref:Uncharacterized protein n=1 Tax=Kordia antarctica TaxID=1218801 RepID=A0A7L4ZRW1_9FLAO|nr:hypothetical protein IMCC3317_46040 [Kordia antarctica]
MIENITISIPSIPIKTLSFLFTLAINNIEPPIIKNSTDIFEFIDKPTNNKKSGKTFKQ